MRSTEEMLAVTREKAVRMRKRRVRLVGASAVVVVVLAMVALAARTESGHRTVRTVTSSTTATTSSTSTTTSEPAVASASPPDSSAVSTTTQPDPTTTTVEHLVAAPGLHLEVTASPSSGPTGTTVGVDTHATDDVGWVYQLILEWGDGSQGAGFIATPSCALGHTHPDGPPSPATFDHHDDHVYESQGTFTVTVTVRSRLSCDDRYDEAQTEEEATQTVDITIE